MKILLSVITIASVLFLSSCKETNEEPHSQNETQTETEIITPTETVTPKPEVATNKEHTAIGELFENRDSYSGKVVVIRGEVTKFNKSILGRNWVHLQDGTGGPGTNDILVTTQETATVGEVVTFQGMVVLNKDFGAGYFYEVLLEMGKLSD